MHRWFRLLAMMFVVVAVAFPAFASTPIPPAPVDRLVVDTANVLGSYAESINTKLMSIRDRATIGVLTVPKLEDGDDIDTFGQRVSETWKLGKAGVDNGVTIVLAVKDRKFRINVARGFESVLTDGRSGEIIRTVVAPITKGHNDKWGEGMDAGVNAVIQIVAPSARPAPGSPMPNMPATDESTSSTELTADQRATWELMVRIAWVAGPLGLVLFLATWFRGWCVKRERRNALQKSIDEALANVRTETEEPEGIEQAFKNLLRAYPNSLYVKNQILRLRADVATNADQVRSSYDMVQLEMRRGALSQAEWSCQDASRRELWFASKVQECRSLQQKLDEMMKDAKKQLKEIRERFTSLQTWVEEQTRLGFLSRKVQFQSWKIHLERVEKQVDPNSEAFSPEDAKAMLRRLDHEIALEKSTCEQAVQKYHAAMEHANLLREEIAASRTAYRATCESIRQDGYTLVDALKEFEKREQALTNIDSTNIDRTVAELGRLNSDILLAEQKMKDLVQWHESSAESLRMIDQRISGLLKASSTPFAALETLKAEAPAEVWKDCIDHTRVHQRVSDGVSVSRETIRRNCAVKDLRKLEEAQDVMNALEVTLSSLELSVQGPTDLLAVFRDARKNCEHNRSALHAKARRVKELVQGADVGLHANQLYTEGTSKRTEADRMIEKANGPVNWIMVQQRFHEADQSFERAERQAHADIEEAECQRRARAERQRREEADRQRRADDERRAEAERTRYATTNYSSFSDSSSSTSIDTGASYDGGGGSGDV